MVINPKSKEYIRGQIVFDSQQSIDGMDIVMVGSVGTAMGANLARNNEAKLREIYSASFVERCLQLSESDGVKQIYKELFELRLSKSETKKEKNNKKIISPPNIGLAYRIGLTGTFSALWEIGYYYNKGLTVDIPSIPVKQEIIEVCEEFNQDPYTGDGRGAFLIVCNNGSNMVEYCTSRGCLAAVVGSINNTKDKIAVYGDEMRYLEPNRIK